MVLGVLLFLFWYFVVLDGFGFRCNWNDGGEAT